MSELDKENGLPLEEAASLEEKESAVQVYNTKLKKKKNRHTVNLLDVLILLLCVSLVAAAIVGITTRRKADNASEQTVEYTLYLRGVPAALSNHVLVGDAVSTADMTKKIGTVTAVNIADASETVLVEGQPVEEKIADAKDIVLTVRASVKYEDGAWMLGEGLRLSVGAAYAVRFPGLSAEALCIGLAVAS